LVGVAVNTMFTGLMNAFNSGTGSNYSGVASIVNANITQKTWSDFKLLVCYAVVGLILSLCVTKYCNLLSLEDKTVRSLGVNVTTIRLIISFIACLLASISTAVIGPISFLGLIVPHIARLPVGSNHKVLIYAQGEPQKIITSELMKEVYGVDLQISQLDGKPFIMPVEKQMHL
jgi:iron complex transport system permease protein